VDRAGLLAALALGGVGLAGLLLARGPAGESVEASGASRAVASASASAASDAAGGPVEAGVGVEACSRSSADEAAVCGRCHAAIHAEWRGSLHAAAFEDSVFRAEYDPAPSSFCADCHAAGRARHGHRAHDGVDCAACHSSREDERASASGAAACAGCHQFDFPPGELGTHGLYDPADPLQDTLREWQASDAARDGIGCVDCHMPWISGGDARHRSHRLLGAGDPALVREAIVATATARRLAEGLEVTVTLAPCDVGHRVPTGDMFRRLRVAAWNEGSEPVEQWLGREFAQLPASDDHGFRLRPAFDDRVPAPGDGEPVRVRLVVPGVHARQARWSVELHRMPPEQARARGLDPERLRTPVAEGVVRVEPG
jgi:hypothetical protein